MIRFALFEPDIPQNTGASIRLGACLGVGIDIIEPCGFPWNEKKMRRGGMDYIDAADIKKHTSWDAFIDYYGKERRLVLMTTKAAQPYTDFTFTRNDVLIAGRESAGVPEDVHETVDERILIPMKNDMRSLNVVNAGAMILGEALRQLQLSQNIAAC